MKRMLAALLLVCIAVGSVVPVASASDTGTSDTPTMEFKFGTYGSNGDYLADCTKTLFNSYIAKTVDWRFEASSNEYQFRIAGKHPDITSTGKNMFALNMLQLCGAKGWWYALRLRASETGKFALELTKEREGVLQIYFFPAAVVENALGPNAVSYAQTICEEPYLAVGTEAFAAYKQVIGGLIETATPAMTESKKQPETMTGEYSFQKDQEYIMVIEFLNEETYRTRLAPLKATWIGEAESNLLDQVQDDTTVRVTDILIPVAIVAVVAGVIIAVVSCKKKTKENT